MTDPLDALLKRLESAEHWRGASLEAAAAIRKLRGHILEREKELRSSDKEIHSARAERDALRAALESIAANTCCDKCQEAALVARAALKARGKP